MALFTLVITVLTATTVSLLLPKQYTASTAVVIDVKSPDPVALQPQARQLLVAKI